MSRSGHDEPWRARASEPALIEDARGHSICHVYTENPLDVIEDATQRSRRDRILLCINACADLTDDDLAMCVDVLRQIKTAMAQRARRERIATAALGGLTGLAAMGNTAERMAACALAVADALMAGLDGTNEPQEEE